MHRRNLLINLCRLSTVWTFLLMSFISYGQSITVTGNVSSTYDNSPIPGVNVIIKDSNIGVATDFDGNYQIDANMGDILVFSYVGFETREVSVTSSTLNVFLEESLEALEDVVVIGYGSVKLEDATGSLTSVSEKDFNQGFIVTPENLLNGRVAGLTISTGGEPGSGSQIRIRGGSSLNDGSNTPLIVIDGLPIDNNTIGGARSILSTINPNDIESFTVLKDASSTAIYGSRAANGVIIINTKRGTNNFQAGLDFQLGVNTIINTVDVFSADEFRAIIAERDAQNGTSYSSLLGDADTDWQEEIYRSSIYSNQNAFVQGALFNVLPTRLSVGHTNQPGLRLTSEFERSSASLSLNPTLFDDHLKISINANMAFEKNRFANGEEANALTFDPTQPVYDPDSPFGGFFQYYNLNNDGVLDSEDLMGEVPRNPVANLLQRKAVANIRRVYGNAKAEYKLHFFPDLSAIINLGFDQSEASGYDDIATNSTTTQPNNALGSFTQYENYDRNRLFDSYLAYNKDFGTSSYIDVTAGYSYQKFERKQFNSADRYNPDSEATLNVQTPLVLIGLFGRANLSLADKYLLTLSYRRDGTSRFSKDNRWGDYPAAALAWKFNEDIFPRSNTISNLKLRLGWGITGQQDIGNGALDLYLARYSLGALGSQYFGGQGNTAIPVAIPQFKNENLQWEETTTYNIGLDFGLFNEKINGAVEVFYKESDKILFSAATADGSNYTNNGYQNIGSFTSEGIEFTLNTVVFRSEEEEGFNWDFNYNAAYIKREIKDLTLDQDFLVGEIDGGTGGQIQTHIEGQAPFGFYVYKQIYDENNRPIEGAYADLNGDNQINDDDKYVYKNGSPDVIMGFRSNMSYKKFDLSFNLRAQFGNYVYNNVNSTRAQLELLVPNAVPGNVPKSVLDTNFNSRTTVMFSDYFIENGSFLKMDNITLGYNFGNIFSGRDQSSVRLSFGVQNVFTITNYSGLDPEVFGGIDNTIYPRPRAYLVGANIRF
ncbi:SusC/RagA family TonB-linked outer membrane protein [Abyssalbus ytuae]|uniref:SusC/RagA family TonB-linked outer membrane protein n=1 Tax=Abyssalbus ytuae TaxID=2926907 RepID=A0A9E7CUL6_9FLAO|nr:SusC/RagA family TonB-linked outer membrane protein [Abyssalbus ytuae]UOB18642.1 SusC/RagA family TonB-linked outer membrane protein [Abyssalbus ytuae]